MICLFSLNLTILFRFQSRGSMVLPVVIVAVAAGGVAAAAGFYFLIRKLIKTDKPPEEGSAMYFPQALPLEYLPKYEKSRPLGQMEFIMMKIHDMDKGVLSVALCLQLKTFVSDGVMKQALGKLARIHPLLKMRIAKNKDNGVPMFEPMNDFSVNYTNQDATNWSNVLTEEIEKKFDLATGPLWRAVFLPKATSSEREAGNVGEIVYPAEGTMILSFQRSIIDEGYLAEFCAQFLRILNDEMGNKMEEIRPFELLPSLDVNFTQNDVHPTWYTSMANRILMVSEKKVENIGEINENEPKVKEITQPKEPKQSSPQAITTMTLDKESTMKFFDKCAKLEVAISAALEVAAVLAYSHNESKKEEVLPLQIEQSIFLKPMLPAIPLEYCGNYSVENVIDTAVPRGSAFLESFWNLAASVTEGLATTMQSAIPIVDAVPLPETEKTDSETPAGIEEAPPTVDQEPDEPIPPPAEFQSIRVATMGACAEGENTKPTVRLMGLFGHIGLRKEGPPLGHCHAAVDEKLCWTLTYRQDQLSKEEAEKLVKKTFDYIKKAITIEPKIYQDIEGVPSADQDQAV